MSINVPVSIGELLDKISILIIKEKNIQDEKKISLVKRELNLLNEILDDFKNKTEIDVYITNDKRSKIKLEINSKFDSEIVEVKSYEQY